MIKSTRNYSIFKKKQDNREIDRALVNRLKVSMSKRNLLHLEPIIVNDDMEIIDGQHRFESAKELGLEISYQIETNLDGEDMILLQTHKSWGTEDYFNYYCKNNYPEYLKLKKFIADQGISVSLAVRILRGTSKNANLNFRNGEFEFNNSMATDSIDFCRRSIEIIKKLQGDKPWMKSQKIWSALLIVFNHENFEEDKWFKNIELLVDRIVQKVSVLDYFNVFKDIFNFKNRNRIEDAGDVQ
jgi:hypothetical protein